MRAVRADGTGVAVVDVDEPTGDGVLIDVVAAGICGSDLHLLDAGFLTVTPGHEIAGFTPDGTAVAIEPMFSCGACVSCLGGEEPYCDDAMPNTMGIGIDGGMAQRVIVPERFLVPLASGVSPHDAALVEPLAVTVRSMGRVGVGAGRRVCVIGAGPIGLAAVAVAKHWGADVSLVARHDHQVEAGLRLGASVATDEPFDIVVDAAGSSASLAEAVRRTRKGGTVGIPATYWSPVEMPGMEMGMKEVSLVPSITYGHTTGPRDVEVAAAVLAATPAFPEAVITHRFALEDAATAFETARDRSAGAIKVVLEPLQ